MISALIPLKITDDRHYKLFCRTFTSYRTKLDKFDTQYIVCDDSAEVYRDRIRDLLKDVNVKYVQNLGTNFYNVIYTLIEQVETKYFLFIMDDVELSGVDVITPSINALEQMPDLIQVKLGHGTLLHDHQIQYRRDYAFVGTALFTPVAIEGQDNEDGSINEHKAWITKITPELKRYETYIFGYWNSVMRTEFFKPYNAHVKLQENNAKSNTFHDYSHNASFFIPNEVYSNDYRTAWLDFANYVFAWWLDVYAISEWPHLGQYEGLDVHI